MLSAFLHLKTLFRRNRVLATLNGRRRFMGLAAFSYALPYLSFYFSYEGVGSRKAVIRHDIRRTFRMEYLDPVDSLT